MSINAVKRKNPLRAMKEAEKGFAFYLGFFLMYTVAFLFGAFLICQIFAEYGSTFLWVEDGAYQHFPAFHYICDTVKGIFKHDGSLASILPFNFTLGQGGDIFTTLNSYDYTDPISWLCAMAFPLSELHRYTLMIFVKLWLCGAAFAIFCFTTDRRNRTAVLCGAASYVFSGAILYVFARHPNYVNWAYFLPLLLAGAELYRRKGRSCLLILSVALNLLISFYTFYINALLLAVYLVSLSVCNIIREKEHRGKTFRTELWLDVRIALWCLTGMAVAAVVLVPTAYAFLQNPRTGELTGYTDSALIYGSGYYETLFATIFTPFSSVTGFTTYLGLFPIVFVAIGAIFSQRKQFTHLKALLILFALFLCIPLAGRIFNGMGYATSRWAYAVPFLCGVILAEAIPLLPRLSVNAKRWILIAGASYIVYCFVRADIRGGNIKLATMAAIGWTLLVFFFISRMNEKVYQRAVVALVLLTIGFAVSVTFRPAMGNYISTYLKKSDYPDNYNDSSKALSGKSTADDFFRVESKELKTNADGVNKVNSTDVWWSMMPSSIYDYYNAFELCSVQQNCNFKGIDDRTSLLELASVRYYTAPKNDSAPVPYGYTLNKELSDKHYQVYENSNALPVACAFDSYMTREAFNALSPVERQEALMQTVVLDEPVDSLKKAQIRTASYSLEYGKLRLKKIDRSGKRFDVKAKGGSMTFTADIPEDCEIYLRLNGIRITDPDSAMVTVDRTTGRTGKISKTTRVSNINYFWPVIRDGVTFNMGVGKAGENTFTVSFSRVGSYAYDAIELYAVPMKQYETDAKKLRSNAIANAHVDARGVSGDYTAQSDCMLQFSVPYSKGFTAYVDGKKAEAVCSDLMYLAVPLSAGSHHIELRYATPYLKEGAIISAVSITGLLLYTLIRYLIRRKKRKDS